MEILRAGRSILYPILYFNQQLSFSGSRFRFRPKLNGGTEFPLTLPLLPFPVRVLSLLTSQGGTSVLIDTLSSL